MKIEILRFLEGASKARGTAVIIDVFRAFSTACYVLGNAAVEIIPVSGIAQARHIKGACPECVLIGERGGVKAPGFDYGNSPSEVKEINFEGMTAVLSTSAGTRGLYAAENSDEVLTGSFVNASATARYIKKSEPSLVSLVCMGWNAAEPADEDFLCAEYLGCLIKGGKSDFSKISRYLKHESRTRSFRDLKGDRRAPEEDFDLCMDADRFGFAVRAVRAPGLKLVKSPPA